MPMAPSTESTTAANTSRQNTFTFIPVDRLHISAGNNSVIWSDSRITPYYLMPIFFYKSVDHGVNSGIVATATLDVFLI
ncbi:MAG: hypothetical protein R2758_04275 [Bacteroidales bacterium]